MPSKSKDKCAYCNLKADEQKCHVMIRCDCCEAWYHSQCQDLTKYEANLISSAEEKGVRWFCTKCIPELVINVDSQDQTEAKTSITELKEKLEEMNLLTMNKFNNIDQAVKGMELTYADALKSNNENIKSLEDQCSKLVEQTEALKQNNGTLTVTHMRRSTNVI
ncbi:hypothetical protein EB796_017978 [Bugula neritina]|uniref:PHD-type domain-containing protein n=1 Tax=Bugula neritina TaxID=10212 RepID=A0A7J7JBS7_BUGNE|nr:hypothetical protein EB796_017978 [Bugula neritina]